MLTPGQAPVAAAVQLHEYSLCLWLLIIKGGLSLSSPERSSLPARRNRELHGGRAGNPGDKKQGLVSMSAQEAFSPHVESWPIPVSVTFLQKFKFYLRDSSPGDRSYEFLCCHRSCGKLDGAMVTHLSKLELAKKTVSRAQARHYWAIGWKGCSSLLDLFF